MRSNRRWNIRFSVKKKSMKDKPCVNIMKIDKDKNNKNNKKKTGTRRRTRRQQQEEWAQVEKFER